MKNKHLVFFGGGLGNQLYMLAYAYLLREEGFENIFLYTTHKAKGDTHNTEKRNILTEIPQKMDFQVLYIPKIQRIIMRIFRKFCNFTILNGRKFYIYQEPDKEWAIYRPLPKNKNQNTIHIGYYQAFEYQEKRFIEKLKTIIGKSNLYKINENDVAIHIRRGDFLQGENANIFSVIEIDYYLKALEILAKEISIGKLYIFTDSPKSIQSEIEKLSEKYQVELVQGNSVLEDLQLLASFQNYVLGNSTFSWWGAKLSAYENPKVIVPTEPWKIKMDKKSPYLKNWKQLNNE